ncbi:MAG: DUF4124 domain-containing protein [Pseudomonadales bacterium]
MQYQCIMKAGTVRSRLLLRQRWAISAALLVACGWVPLVVAQSAAIYRSVAADGTVSYSDQRLPGATPVPDLLIVPASAEERAAAKAEADARIERQLALAAELAEQRRARSEQRENAALVRAELRESKARQQVLEAQQQAEQRYENERYTYPWPPVYRQRPNRRDRYRDDWRPFEPPRLPPPSPPLLPEQAPRSRPLPPD